MTSPAPMVEIWRGEFLESQHLGHAVVTRADGEIMASWGDASKTILPRSSCKMVQALPLIESGAADAFGLNSEQLALACASHNGAAIHTDRVSKWLASIGLSDDDLRCGSQMPSDKPAREALIKTDTSPCQHHNNCSGKHAGFLTLAKHLGAGPEYVDPDHPVQLGVREVFAEMTGEAIGALAIDGCSAPNFAMTLTGLARAVAQMADPASLAPRRKAAAEQLVAAMMKHPELVAGETRACTELMRAAPGVAIKTGAEGVFVAILPTLKLGVALKIEDGATRAAEAAMATLLIRLGVLDLTSEAAQKRVFGPIKNWRGIHTGQTRAAPAFFENGKPIN